MSAIETMLRGFLKSHGVQESTIVREQLSAELLGFSKEALKGGGEVRKLVAQLDGKPVLVLALVPPGTPRLC